MKAINRLVAALLVCAMLVACAGCDLFVPNAVSPSGSDVPSVADAPPEEPPKNEELAALDMEMFENSVTSDILSYNLTIADPDAFDFEKPQAWWGDFSYEAGKENVEQCTEWLDRLHEIDRDSLNRDDRITYDTFEQDLQSTIDIFPYYYYDEVLTPYNGIQTYLALNLVFFKIRSLEDIEDYLLLVEDTPRFMEQILAFEQEKSAAGLFMTDDMLDEILGQISDFTESRKSCFLFDTFVESIDEIEMDADTREAFIERNIAAVNALVDSYEMLYDGLEELRGTNTNPDGLCAYGEDGRAFFALGVQDSACNLITPQEAMTILENEMDAQMENLQKALTLDPSVAELYDTIELTLGTTEENLEYLKSLYVGYYPELPEHTVTYINCPEVLEDQFSPAAYLIPPVDDASENLIILNDKTMSNDTRYLDTLAHEGYPGHLYHYMYIRTLTEKTGYTRQALDLTGYYEAWSQTGEDFFDNYNHEFNNAYCILMNSNSLLSGLLLCSIFSIGVNYEGWTVDDVSDYLLLFFSEAVADEYGQIFYDEAVQNPFYYLDYSLGLSTFSQKQREIKKKLRLDFELLDYNEAYLNIGPTYFNIALPLMDEWADNFLAQKNA